MMQKLYAFLARAPALQGLTVQVGDVGPAPGTAGLWAGGITVLDRRQNLLGTVRQRCRAEFTLRLCLPDTRAENEARLLALQAWIAAESAARRTPMLGSEPQQECLRAEQGRMERAEPGGTAVYTLHLQAEYTQLYLQRLWRQPEQGDAALARPAGRPQRAEGPCHDVLRRAAPV